MMRSSRAIGSARRARRSVVLLSLLATTLGWACAGSGTVRAPASASGSTSVRFPDRWALSAAQPPTIAHRGMVVSTDSAASAAGLEVLRAGGNAVDAAIAVQFALAVTHPQAGNIGGGGFMLVRLADGTTAALDFREKAPGGAYRDMYLNEAGDATRASWTGHLASGVPGSVAGMEAAHARFGTLPWRRLLAPAIGLARGFRMSRELSEDLASARRRLGSFPQTRAVFYPDGVVVPPGESFAQQDLARSLEAIAAGGADAFYRGWIADSVAAEMARGGGLIDRADLAAYVAVWRDPVRFTYRGREILSMPPPSSGGVTLAQLLHIVSGFDLTGLGWHSAEAIHVSTEAMRRAYADRNRYLGDPDFVSMPLDRLLSPAHADSLRATIDLERATDSDGLDPLDEESPETTHFSIVDEAGNAVAVTTTLNGSFGSGVIVRGAGFLLNNEMDDFAVKPGEPNAYGLVQGEANAIQAGKRMLSSMTPTMVLGSDGRPELITGSPGGATIITTVFQILVNHLDYGFPVQASVNAPRFHHQHLPDRIQFESGGLSEAIVRELRRRGHTLSERSGYSGDVQSIYVGPDGTLYGASDPRRGGAALGY